MYEADFFIYFFIEEKLPSFKSLSPSLTLLLVSFTTLMCRIDELMSFILLVGKRLYTYVIVFALLLFCFSYLYWCYCFI